MPFMKFRFPIWSIPLLIFFVCVMAFGLLIPGLGFYWDDWTVIYLTKVKGLWGMKELLAYDRPFSIWMYVIANMIGGTNPTSRQILALLVRCFSVIALWWAFKEIWLGHIREITWIVLLYAIYPAFIQQSIAVTYTQGFLLYSIYFLSIGFMVKAFRSDRFFWLFSFIAVGLSVLHIVTVEYFVGLEMFRPIVLWFILEDRFNKKNERLINVARYWLPYALVLFVLAVWRLFFVILPDDTNAPKLLKLLMSQPANAMVDLIQYMVRDFIYIVIPSWYKSLQPEIVNIQDRFILFTWGIATLTGLLVAFFMSKMNSSSEMEKNDTQKRWLKQIFFSGIYCIVVGLIPIWIAGRDIGNGYYADRFSLPALMGGSMFIVSLIGLLIQNPKHQLIIFSVLVGLAVGLHLRIANDYRQDWTNQKRFYWQLYWRAPSILPQTAIISSDSIFTYTNGYALSSAISTLYPPVLNDGKISYWFVDAYDTAVTRGGNLREFLNGTNIEFTRRSFKFSGSSLNTLMIDYKAQDHCLWVLNPNDVYNSELPSIMKDILPVANLNRIVPEASKPGYPLKDIYGEEPYHDWCYYYQKADLARQQKDWLKVLQYWEEADKLGYQPTNAFEFIPFIEAYGTLGEWTKAGELSREASKWQLNSQAMLCATWKRFRTEPLNDRSSRDQIYSKINQRLKCP